MKVTYENDYIVFDINKGPKQITEVLNAKFFMVRATYEMPDTRTDEGKELNKLWGTKSGE